jgi:hypothetical protein
MGSSRGGPRAPEAAARLRAQPGQGAGGNARSRLPAPAARRAAVLEYVRELHGVDAPGAAAVLSVKLDVRQRVWAAALRSVRT